MYCAATVGTRCHPSYNILHIIPTLAPPPHGSIPRTHSNGREPQLLLLPLHPRRSVRPLPRRRKCAERRRHIRKVRARHGRRRRRRQRCRPQRRTSEEGEAVRPTGPGRCFCVYRQRRQGSPLFIARLAGIVHHRARNRAINRTANLQARAVQLEEADVAVCPIQAGYRRARPQVSPLFDKHRPKLKRTMRNQNCQESCRVQR